MGYRSCSALVDNGGSRICYDPVGVTRDLGSLYLVSRLVPLFRASLYSGMCFGAGELLNSSLCSVQTGRRSLFGESSVEHMAEMVRSMLVHACTRGQ
jgi:hypothetical protein